MGELWAALLGALIGGLASTLGGYLLERWKSRRDRRERIFESLLTLEEEVGDFVNVQGAEALAVLAKAVGNADIRFANQILDRSNEVLAKAKELNLCRDAKSSSVLSGASDVEEKKKAVHLADNRYLNTRQERRNAIVRYQTWLGKKLN